VTARGAVEPIAPIRGGISVFDRADGSTVVGCFLSTGSLVYEVRAGKVRELDRRPRRFMAFAERQGVLWAAYDHEIVRIAAGEPIEMIRVEDGLPSGGGLLVDREGSLWVATFRGVAQLPEPDTVSWHNDAPGVGRHVILNRGTVWMSSWGALFRVSPGPEGWQVAIDRGTIQAPCADGRGNVWTVHDQSFVVIAPDLSSRRVAGREPVHDLETCAPSPDGGMWLPTGAGLHFLGRDERDPRLVVPTPEGPAIQTVLEDSRGTLWIARTGEICSTPVARAMAGAPDFRCSPIENEEHINDLAEMPSGAIWAATYQRGIWRSRESGGFEPIPASSDLASPSISAIVASPAGGVWIVGEGNFLRVRERTDSPGGWEVLERIGIWQGLPTSGVHGVAEADDGTLWAATNMSLVRIPPEARRARPEPPPVALVEATVDGRPLDFSGGREIELPYRRNRLELRFAALSYRDPGLIRYRVRSKPREPWSAPTKQPFFRFVDLPPGRYRIGVEASLDGERWSEAAGDVSFEVLRPWWATLWFRSALVALLAAGLLLAYRLRIAYLLRLERQRMRIAMDLHDEVGSGLGSIGVLAGLLSRDDLPDPQRRDLSTRIAGVSKELSQSLGDIVWSLRAGSGTLDSLFAKILDRARPLFAAGRPTLHVRAPEPVPVVPLSLAVRRNVSLIAIEALHNAARHAGAANVTLALDGAGESWTVTVTDDGNGFRPEAGDPTRRGLGLEAMRTRAAEMGGAVAWEPGEAGGTRVVVRFRAGRG
jgi:signal transduction histidine kinase